MTECTDGDEMVIGDELILDVACRECSEHGEPDEASDAVMGYATRQSYSSYSKEEYKAFRCIDRDEEDRLVRQYRRTKNPQDLLKLLKLRDQTLRYMAKKYAYLDNEDDMYSEFKDTWLKCVKKYDWRANMRVERDKKGIVVEDADGNPKMVSKKTPFNTYLYTSMKYRVSNILKKRNSKRQLDGNGKPAVETMRSLDYQYGPEGDMTLKDVIPDYKANRSSSGAELADIMHHLGTSDPDILRAVKNYEANPSLGSLPAAGNYRVGTLIIGKADREVLASGAKTEDFTPNASAVNKASEYLRKMIEATRSVTCKFDVYSFDVHHGRVDFVVKVDDPELVRKIKDAIAKCRKLYPDFHPSNNAVDA